DSWLLPPFALVPAAQELLGPLDPPLARLVLRSLRLLQQVLEDGTNVLAGACGLSFGLVGDLVLTPFWRLGHAALTIRIGGRPRIGDFYSPNVSLGSKRPPGRV